MMFDWKIKKESDEELKRDCNKQYFMTAVLASLGTLLGIIFVIMAFFGKETNFMALFNGQIVIVAVLALIASLLMALGHNQYKIMLELRELKGGKSGKKK